jgi:hypothetical protein
MTDKNDFSDEEVLAMWDAGEPVQLAPSCVHNVDSYWTTSAEPTASCGFVLLSTTVLKYYGPTSRGKPRQYESHSVASHS